MNETIIEIENLGKTFGKHEALRAVSLVIKKGDVFGIVGLSGAGKSTLIRCLASLETPSSGKIIFDDEDVARLSEKDLRQYRKKIGMIFQHFNLFPSRTVEENVRFPLEIAGDAAQNRIDELLELVGLQDKKHHYPSQLSGGQKQRVGIARALANHPKVLFCDEATSALDPKTTREILSLLKKFNEKLGLTIVIITHEMDVVKEICNQVAVMDKGQIVETGEVVNIFTAPKENITKNFLQNRMHDLPEYFYKNKPENHKLLRLNFSNEAGEPVISHMVKNYLVEANILMGWLDNVQNIMVGNLVIELCGTPENITAAMDYLRQRNVNIEVLEK